MIAFPYTPGQLLSYAFEDTVIRGTSMRKVKLKRDSIVLLLNVEDAYMTSFLVTFFYQGDCFQYITDIDRALLAWRIV